MSDYSIDTARYASLVEVAARTRKSLEWLQGEAREGRIPVVRSAGFGWLMRRPDAESFIKEWNE